MFSLKLYSVNLLFIGAGILFSSAIAPSHYTATDCLGHYTIVLFYTIDRIIWLNLKYN